MIFWYVRLEGWITGMLHYAHLRECDLKTYKQQNVL